MTEPLSPTQLAYLAGVIDARGHIEISMRHERPQPRLAVTTSRKELLAFLCQHTGTKISDEARPYERRPCGEHCKEQHSHVVRQSAKWRVDSARATIVLWNIRPFIVSQVDEVRKALLAGLDAWPAARGNTGTQMAALGWELPPALRKVPVVDQSPPRLHEASATSPFETAAVAISALPPGR